MQVVRALADNVVMYLGQIMEKCFPVLNSPKHPYTKLDRVFYLAENILRDRGRLGNMLHQKRVVVLRCPQNASCTEDSIPLDSMDSVLL